ncbi:Gas vesicle protein [Saccharopolyspora kobensis]|uniref:Gas vesicle protein n=2 Tax=Saccharopolyspora kobensis TaxID=146035 RepID=A0A1H6AD21_9PSEU|nr:Gas vesicle protein [Saccharopolyspora kobensis]SFE54496.1 Gas vesicle protein [Saccharopolyspora kobensis]
MSEHSRGDQHRFDSRAPMAYSPRPVSPARSESGGANLADILERVLDKGIVIAGDIQVNLLDIELLTIKLRLVVASVERAREMGIDWWEHDPTLSSGHRDLAVENRRLRDQVRELGGEPAELEGGADEEQDRG